MEDLNILIIVVAFIGTAYSFYRIIEARDKSGESDDESEDGMIW